MALPMSFDNIHYYYNKSSTNSWIVPKCFTGDLIVTDGVLYYFPHTAGQYKPKGTEYLGLIGALADAALATKNQSRLLDNGLWFDGDTSESLQRKLDAHIDELRTNNRRQEAASLLGQSTFKWYLMLLSEKGRATLSYPERFTRNDIKNVGVNLAGVFTVSARSNDYTFNVGLLRKSSFSEALWQAGLIHYPLT